ncbi:MAG TPA: acetoacetate--CoA ligase [Gemmatimonadales bacterium]|jgi:acetoacetyl-CoA synthetase
MTSDPVIWRPDPGRAHDSQLARLIDRLRNRGVALPFDTDAKAFQAMHAWSIDHLEEFWAEVWRDGAVIADSGPDGIHWDQVVVGADRMAPPDPELGPRWFTGSRLNFAENLLRRDDDDPAIIAWGEGGPESTLTWRQLRRDVAQVAASLRDRGVEPGDRVAAWVPNIPETVVAMLAAASLGAIWTSCSPDFGVDSIVDRFGQTEPVVLIFCDGYRYAGRVHDCSARAAELLARLPSVRHAVMIDYTRTGTLPADSRAERWSALIDRQGDAELRFTRLPFDHPLYILYSSGTTGLPKCMVHSQGGTLLQHLKEHRLHVDLRRGERLFYFTTCGWMMWNWQVSALAAEATLVLYDGSPLPPHEPDILWRMAAEAEVDVFGTSAKYLALAEKSGLEPSKRHHYSRLRAILSTGSPLAAESFDWIYRAVGAGVQVASISGGTDIVSCFVLGNPMSPIHRGEIQGPGLGMAVDVFDETGSPCGIGVPGELVCTRPFPAMPRSFWNDPDGSRYRAAYFDTYPGVWRHGDWIATTPSGGFVISGRSDATLNPGGVRIGTAEIYRQVDAIPEVVESLVIGQRIPGQMAGDERIILFVRLREGVSLTDSLRDAIRGRIRAGTSPHHVPKVIAQVGDIPRTRSGKPSEIAVRDVVEGRNVTNAGALANPESLDQFRGRAELL